MKMKRKNPYQMLMEDIKDWANKVRYRHEVTMWTYPKNRLHEAWVLNTLSERVLAAEQLGYDVLLVTTEEGLLVRYKKKVPTVPYWWQ